MGTRLTPYYEQSGIAIYHCEALAVLDQWEGLRTQSFDLLLTDPPYGIGEAAGRNRTRSGATKFGGVTGKRVEAVDYGVSDWDDSTQPEALALARQISKHHIIFGGNYYDLPKTRCWLFWDKDNSGDFADGELAWTNLDKAVRRLIYRWNGMLQQPGRAKEVRVHPTQKPEPVMVWALTQAPADVKTVLDPFMGSGTTLVAAKRLGKQAVGIEREERFCEVAAKRLSQEALPLEMGA